MTTERADAPSRSPVTATALAEAARDDARSAGLSYVNAGDPGIRRLKTRTGFRYVDADGKPVRDDAALARIRRIAIPPAWTDVWIAPTARGHIQATGRDARGRKQYRYHAGFRSVRDATKYDHMLAFATALKSIRRRIRRDMRLPGLPRAKVLATVVQILDLTLIRVGNAAYARDNHSFGVTTLRGRHVTVKGTALTFMFKGKSGKIWNLCIHEPRVARIVRTCQELPGQHLFQYLDEDGSPVSIGSGDVNAYLREIAGIDVTAKDFRTWAGTVHAATALAGLGEWDTEVLAKANVREAVEQVSRLLGNTPAICRKCYIHPAVIEAYLAGETVSPARTSGRGLLKPEEAALAAWLAARAGSGRAGRGQPRARKAPARTRSTTPHRAGSPQVAALA